MTSNTNESWQRGTYFADPRSGDELVRVSVQDQMTTAGMGGVLPEQPDTTQFRRILDVGCGTGGWLIEMAKALPDAVLLAGIDINKNMIARAREQASAQGPGGDRVEFAVMDALQMIEFPQNFFDLINMRFGDSYLRTWDWPNLIGRFLYVAKAGCIIRLTEGEHIIQSNSSALTRLFEIGNDAFFRAGHSFHPRNDGVTSELAPLLHQFGMQNIQTRAHQINYRAGTPELQRFYEDMSLLFRTSLHFYRRWIRIPDDYDQIYQQALKEMQQPDFQATIRLLTAWGTVPRKYERPVIQ
jgi:SAM-dependent methyltransferase